MQDSHTEVFIFRILIENDVGSRFWTWKVFAKVAKMAKIAKMATMAKWWNGQNGKNGKMAKVAKMTEMAKLAKMVNIARMAKLAKISKNCQNCRYCQDCQFYQNFRYWNSHIAQNVQALGLFRKNKWIFRKKNLLNLHTNSHFNSYKLKNYKQQTLRKIRNLGVAIQLTCWYFSKPRRAGVGWLCSCKGLILLCNDVEMSRQLSIYGSVVDRQ